MIARAWHGVVPESEGNAYFDYLQRTGIPDLKATVGNRGVYVLRRTVDAQAHFLLISMWESIEAIQAFAGQDVDQARYYPKDREFLLELEPTVAHYEVLLAG
jgi:heme-degrading monooxygenase HmoA